MINDTVISIMIQYIDIDTVQLLWGSLRVVVGVAKGDPPPYQNSPLAPPKRAVERLLSTQQCCGAAAEWLRSARLLVDSSNVRDFMKTFLYF